MVNYDGLIESLEKSGEDFGILTMQATSTMSILADRFGDRIKALYAAEHGFFGSAAPGVQTASSWHPFWNKPIHSLYGEHRKPTPEMLEGIGRMVIDLQDLGVRCYTYLATIKNVLEACSEAGIPVTVLDRPIPMGGFLDGPMRKPEFASFVAPVNVPLCHGMTPGEEAVWIKDAEGLELDLEVIRMTGWTHKDNQPWQNFVPPSPSIRSWDSAVTYPMSVFTEAFPAIDCDRDGSMAFRVIGAPWLDSRKLAKTLGPGLETCGVKLRPYRYSPMGGHYKGLTLNGILLTVPRASAFYPVTAAVMILSAIAQLYPRQLMIGARLSWLDKLTGSTRLRETLDGGDLNELFTDWIMDQDEYLKTKVNLYK
ncbi:MAG: DUF1343 domain-containing protein [Kiritimatiellae bacterium]|nr:DUF1343 domain-containing protein [Kiritimatiellia bacterium]